MARILLIDEETIARGSLDEQLRSLGHEVTLADGGASGCAAARREEFDFAFVSAIMPGMDGLETTRALKALRPAMPVFILLVASRLRSELVSRLALALGADRVLPSPISDDLLRSLLGDPEPPGG